MQTVFLFVFFMVIFKSRIKEGIVDMTQSVILVGVEWDVVDLLESVHTVKCKGILESKHPQECYDLPYLGTDSDWGELLEKDPSLKVVFGLELPKDRKRFVNLYGEDSLITIYSPDAYVSSRVSIGAGTLIQRGVNIMPKAQVGCCCKINVNATIHYESCIGHFCTIAPGAQVLGRVTIGNFAYIGAGAVIKQNCSVGEGAVVGAGSVVIQDVPPNTTVIGSPARELVKNKVTA